MSRVQAITGATAEEFDELRDKARELGKATKFSASQAAEAMSVLAVGGFSVSEILKTMTPLLNLAAAGELEMATAADLAIKIMRGMGIEAENVGQAMDVMVKAFTSANTNLEMLGEAMKYVGPVAKASGKGLEEIVAVLQVLANAGIQASMAGTTIRSMLIRLSGGAPEAAKALKKLRVSVDDGTGRMRHLADIIDDLKAAMEGMTEIERQNTAARIAGLRGIAGFSELLGQGGDAIRDYEKTLDGAGGTSAEIARIMEDNLVGAVTILKSALGELSITINDTFKKDIRAAVEKATTWVLGLADTFAEYGQAIKEKFFGVIKAGFNEVKEIIAVTGVDVAGFFGKFTEGIAEFDSFGKQIQAVLLTITSEIGLLSDRLEKLVADITYAVSESLATVKDTLGNMKKSVVEFFTGDPTKYLEDEITGRRPGQQTPEEKSRAARVKAKLDADLKWQKAQVEAADRLREALERLAAPDLPAPVPAEAPAPPAATPGEKTRAKATATPVAEAMAEALITSISTALGTFKIGQKSRQEVLAERQLAEQKDIGTTLDKIERNTATGGGWG
jgi:TP901 family phage tail tape measure protein